MGQWKVPPRRRGIGSLISRVTRGLRIIGSLFVLATSALSWVIPGSDGREVGGQDE
jgi:hypothetical protein